MTTSQGGAKENEGTKAEGIVAVVFPLSVLVAAEEVSGVDSVGWLPRWAAARSAGALGGGKFQERYCT